MSTSRDSNPTNAAKIGTTVPSVRIILLGPFKVQVAGAELEPQRWRGRKAQQLIKLLALQAGNRLHRERILEFLWPSLDAESAENQLRKAIYTARRALEPMLAPRDESRFVKLEDRAVVLDVAAGIDIDVGEFEREAARGLQSRDIGQCERALRLYSGELLPDDLYEEWTISARARLSALRERLLTLQGELYLESSQVDEAAAAFASLLAVDGANERAYRGLMQVAVHRGDRHYALQLHRECVAALDRELGVGPSRETEALAASIERGGSLLGSEPEDEAQVHSASLERLATLATQATPRLGSAPVASRTRTRGLWRLVLGAVIALVVVASVAAVVATKDRRAVRGASSGASAVGFVTLTGVVDAPGSRVYAAGPGAGWAAVVGRDGHFLIPGVHRSDGRPYKLFVWSGSGPGRLLDVAVERPTDDDGALDVGDLRAAYGRDVAPAAVSDLDLGGRLVFDEPNRLWYEGVFRAVTLNATTDAARFDDLLSFVAARYSAPSSPHPPLTARATIENGSRSSYDLCVAMATLAHAAGYDVRLVDMAGAEGRMSHTAVEAYYDGDWHLYDVGYGARTLNSAGRVASYDELVWFPDILSSLALPAESRPGWRTDDVRRYYASGVHRVHRFDP